MVVSVRAAIVSEFEHVAKEQHHKLAALTDDRPLMEAGLDSLAFAIVVARLEDALGVDPFSESEEALFPVTFGDFVRMYEAVYDKTIANAAR